jgi:hypothetical protein
MKAWFIKFWFSHTQLALGLFEAAAGSLEYIDANTINLVGGFFGTTYGPLVSKGLQVGSGLAIAFRARQVRQARQQVPSGA